MIPDVDLETPALKPCAAVDDPFTSDLTWMLHRAERVLTRDFDEACKQVGLKDMRDTLVLAVAGDGFARTQIEIASTLGLDKTTLSTIIERLESQAMLERKEDPNNRRSKITTTTPLGMKTLKRALALRDELVADTMSKLGEKELSQLRTLLWRIVS